MPKATDLTLQTLSVPPATPLAATPQRKPRDVQEDQPKAPATPMAALQAKVTPETHLAMKTEAMRRGVNLGELLTECFNAYMQQKH